MNTKGRPPVVALLDLISTSLSTYVDLDQDFGEATLTNFAKVANDAKRMSQSFDEPFRLAIVGEFKAGKSSFINSIFGGTEELVKEGVTVTTGVVTELWFGEEEEGHVFLSDGTLHFKGTRHEASKYADQRTPEGKALKGKGARVKLTVNNLALQNIVVIDTPGLGSSELDDKVTYDSLIQADAALLVLNSHRPVSESVQNLAYELRKTNKQIVCVLSKADQYGEEELQRSAASVHEALGNSIDGAPLFYSALEVKEAIAKQLNPEVSDEDAKSANEALHKWGFAEVQTRLSQDYFTGDGKAIHARNQANLGDALRMLEDLQRNVTQSMESREKQRVELVEELGKMNRYVHQVLEPKVEPINAKLEEIVELEVGEFLSDLGEALELFIEKKADGSLQDGIQAIWGKLNANARKAQTRSAKDEFQRLFPDENLHLTQRSIEKKASRLIKMEWRSLVGELKSEAKGKSFSPEHLLEDINKHLVQVTSTILVELTAFIAFIFASGGLALLAFGIANVAGGYGVATGRKGNQRVQRTVRQAKLELRQQKKILTEKLVNHYEEINKQTFDRVKQDALEGSEKKELEKSKLIDRIERWTRSHQTIARLLAQVGDLS